MNGDQTRSSEEESTASTEEYSSYEGITRRMSEKSDTSREHAVEG